MSSTHTSAGSALAATLRMSRRLRRVGLVLTACVMTPAIAFAQGPWTVTVTPTMNPLPVGSCAAIQLTVFDASVKDVPRNRLGVRVTIADFDIAVSSPNGTSAAAQQIDAYHWLACACQGAAAGTVATVTATYPAQSLAVAARVPNVAFQRMATFVLSKPNGTINPPACLTAGAPAIGALPVAPPAPVAPIPVPVPAAPPRAVAVPPVAPPAIVAPTPAPVPPAPPGAIASPPVAPPVAVAPATSPAAPVGGAAVAGGAPAGVAITGGASGRERPYEPGPVTVSLALSANGSWYEAGPVSVGLALSAQGSWYEPAPMTVPFALSATGNWIEPKGSPVRTLQPAPPVP